MAEHRGPWARPVATAAAAFVGLVVLLVVSACGAGARKSTDPPAASATGGPALGATSDETPRETDPTVTAETPAEAGPTSGDGTPRTAALSIPAVGIEGLEVVPYEGRTDDGPGSLIQDRGIAASPHGPGGGTGPGGVGSYQVTAHRNSAGGPFLRVPELERGDLVLVVAGGTRWTYQVTRTFSTSFRSQASLAAQRAAVPGRPGIPATRAMILVSTCATQEDHAAGNYWSDEHDNPEHRIDKVGVLVASEPA